MCPNNRWSDTFCKCLNPTVTISIKIQLCSPQGAILSIWKISSNVQYEQSLINWIRKLAWPIVLAVLWYYLIHLMKWGFFLFTISEFLIVSVWNVKWLDVVLCTKCVYAFWFILWKWNIFWNALLECTCMRFNYRAEYI